MNIRRESRGQGRKTKNGEIGLIGETAAITIAEKAGGKGTEHHAEKSCGDKLRVLAESGKAAAEHGAEDGGDQVKVEAVEEHADADEAHDAAMERRNWEAVQAGAGVYRGQIISP